MMRDNVIYSKNHLKLIPTGHNGLYIWFPISDKTKQTKSPTQPTNTVVFSKLSLFVEAQSYTTVQIVKGQSGELDFKHTSRPDCIFVICVVLQHKLCNFNL